MWRLIYNLLAYSALPFFTVFGLARKKIRRNFLERLAPEPPGKNLTEPIWIHAASVGEAFIAENFVNYVRPKVKNDFIVTTNTYYTRDLLRKRFQGSIAVFSLPFDLPYSIRRFIGTSAFAALLLVETEIWPNLIWGAKRSRIPVLIINGRISDATLVRYRRLSFFLKSVLSSVDLVLAQSEEQAQRFISLGMAPSKVVNTGNLKYYREIKKLPPTGPKEHMVTFGSIREKELPQLIPVIIALKEEFPHMGVFLAPRELTLISAIERELPDAFRVTRYSAIKEDGAGGPSGLVLVDTVGDLVEIYARSLVAFVGGSLAAYGGQNLLEPLFVGTPVIFGTHVENFRTVAEDIIALRAGFMVKDGAELLSTLRLVLGDEGLRNSLVASGRAVLEMQNGVMEKAARLVLEAIWKNSRDSSN
jgi:3-deoxy-D-manno-octulosonic-acid transferase